ncbi:MAG: acyltransferase [Butyrivibrio sp.]|jgi:fucose 4-O-acetylase-like acetyltransferase|nr:acyltransferase [Butyrivibrio sp.]
MSKEKNTSQKRISKYDFAKGIAAILVIIYHNYTLYEQRSLIINTILSTLHNPLFFLVSGYLLSKSVKHYPKNELVKYKIVDLLLVSSIWVIVETFIFVILNHDFSISYSLIKEGILWSANRLWFLPVLYCAQILSILLYKSSFDKKVFITSVLLWGMAGIIVGLYSTVLCKFLLFSLLVWLGINNIRSIKYCLFFYLLMIICFVLTTFVAFTDFMVPGVKCSICMTIVFFGGYAAIYIIETLPSIIIDNRIICFIGRYSIIYYILSVFSLVLFDSLENYSISFGGMVLRIIINIVFSTCVAYLIGESILGKFLFRPSSLLKVK